MRNVLHFLARLSFALIFFAALSFHKADAQARLGGPEDTRIGCQSARECPAARVRPGQDPRCVQAACLKNVCVSAVTVGRQLGVESAGNLACYAQPLVCSSQGTAVPDPDPAKQVAQNEGQVCVYTSTLPACSIARCRNKQCVQENNDGAACTNAPLNSCQKGVCQGGFCSAVADPQKAGVQCQTPQTSGCVTTQYQCSSTGMCNPKNVVAAGKECAPGVGYNSNQAALPAGFKALFTGTSTAPRYGCTSACKLEYCGDATVQSSLGEACDTTGAMRPNTICSKCQVTCSANAVKDKFGSCCLPSQKDANNICCPAGKTPSCGSCDGCKQCETARCRLGGPYAWPMGHLGPGCAPAQGWVLSAGCGECRVDVAHGASIWKVPLFSDSNVVGAQTCANPKNGVCSVPGKKGWIYAGDPYNELVTAAESSRRMPCKCVNGTITCPCNGDTTPYRECVAFNSVGCAVGPQEKMPGLNYLPGSNLVANTFEAHCIYSMGSYCVFCGKTRPAGQGCFDPDTEVLLEEGVVKLAHQIRIGDRLYNPLTKFSREVKKITHGQEVEPMIEFGFEGYLLKVTRTHPVLTTHGMKRAESIVVGDVVFDAFGGEQAIQYVRQSERVPNQRVFNFELATDSSEYMDRLLVSGNIISGDLSVQNGTLEGE
jgi:hypothetical protein